MKKAKINASVCAPVELELIVSLDDDGEAMIHQVSVQTKSIKVKKFLQSLDEEDSEYIDELAQEALGWSSGGDEDEYEDEDEDDE